MRWVWSASTWACCRLAKGEVSEFFHPRLFANISQSFRRCQDEWIWARRWQAGHRRVPERKEHADQCGELAGRKERCCLESISLPRFCSKDARSSPDHLGHVTWSFRPIQRQTAYGLSLSSCISELYDHVLLMQLVMVRGLLAIVSAPCETSGWFRHDRASQLQMHVARSVSFEPQRLVSQSFVAMTDSGLAGRYHLARSPSDLSFASNWQPLPQRPE